jgi:hypothetical protein
MCGMKREASARLLPMPHNTGDKRVRLQRYPFEFSELSANADIFRIRAQQRLT